MKLQNNCNEKKGSGIHDESLSGEKYPECKEGNCKKQADHTCSGKKNWTFSIEQESKHNKENDILWLHCIVSDEYFNGKSILCFWCILITSSAKKPVKNICKPPNIRKILTRRSGRLPMDSPISHSMLR